MATGQDDVGDSSSVTPRQGDPVKLVSTGGVIISLTTEQIFGVIDTVYPHWDTVAERMTISEALPNQLAWGTVEDRRSYLGVIPAHHAVWELDCDDKTTFTTRATYHDCIGENCNHTVAQGVTGFADPLLDISSNATTATLTLRILGISDTLENRDFSGLYVKMLVTGNANQFAGSPSNATIIVGI